MATKLFFRNADADTHLGTNNTKLNGIGIGWFPKALSVTSGPGLITKITDTVAGPTNGVEATNSAGGSTLEWLSPPVSADVTISGAITGNIWASENGMNANVAINFVVDVIRATNNSIVQIVKSARTTELNVTTTTVNNFTATPGAGVTVNRGDRIRVRIFGDDAGTMGQPFTFSIRVDDTNPGADGDTYISFTETFAFESDPTGTTLYLTDTACPVDVVSDTGFLAGGTYANIDRTALVDWVNPGNASASDNVYATNANLGSGTDYLVCSNLGVAIPTGSIIRGVVVEVEGKTTLASDVITCQLQDAVGALVGDTKTVTLTSTESTQTAGAQDDNWNAALTEAIVEDIDFGVRIWSTTLSVETISIDRIRVKVFYAPTAIAKEAWTSRGSGVVTAVTDTVAGWTVPIQVKKDNTKEVPLEWYSRPLQAFTLGGMAKFNLGALQSATSKFASLKAELAVVNGDGSSPVVWASWCIAPLTAHNSELTTVESAETANVSGDDLAVSNGQRLRLRICMDDSSIIGIVAAQTVTFFYAGTSGGASGDSYVILPQSVSEFVASGPVHKRRPGYRFLQIR